MSTTTPDPNSSNLPAPWRRLADDAATFPPGNAALPDAVAAHRERRSAPWADLVGRFVVKDTDLPHLRDFEGPLAVVVTGGAGQLAGPLEFAARHDLRVEAVEIALRDLDDLAGNARRVTAALDRSAWAATFASWCSCEAMTSKASSTPAGRLVVRVIFMGPR